MGLLKTRTAAQNEAHQKLRHAFFGGVKWQWGISLLAGATGVAVGVVTSMENPAGLDDALKMAITPIAVLVAAGVATLRRSLDRDSDDSADTDTPSTDPTPRRISAERSKVAIGFGTFAATALLIYVAVSGSPTAAALFGGFAGYAVVIVLFATASFMREVDSA